MASRPRIEVHGPPVAVLWFESSKSSHFLIHRSSTGHSSLVRPDGAELAHKTVLEACRAFKGVFPALVTSNPIAMRYQGVPLPRCRLIWQPSRVEAFVLQHARDGALVGHAFLLGGSELVHVPLRAKHLTALGQLVKQPR